MLPLIAAYLPFALVIGNAVAEHGDRLAGWSGSWLIYGGSAHLTALRTLDDAGAAAAIVAALLLNARLLLYSADLARAWRGQPRWFRLVAAGLIIDPTWAVGQRHAAGCSNLRDQRRFFLAAGLTLGTGWAAAIAVGAVAGGTVTWLDLDIVVPLCMLALVSDRLQRRNWQVVAASVAAALATGGWPPAASLPLVVIVGCATGALADARGVA
jgi:predicted branched-subunit amino acid permease